MIWFALALFVISFLVTAFLSPKPHLEDARASRLEPDSFPRATENAPIPLVIGKVRMKAPNTAWYGDLETVAIREKVKTGIFSSKNLIVGYRYFIGLDMALCMGPGVHLHEIYMDGKLVWSGDVGDDPETEIEINAPTIFGGYKEGGGWVGTAKFYNGDFDQPRNDYMLGLEEVGPTKLTSYPGVSHIVFEANEIGESPALRKMAFVISRYTNDLSLSGDGLIGDDDINAAEALYQIMTDTWSGLGISTGAIDTTAMQAMGETLYTENHGCSVLVTAETQGKELVTELLRQVDGTFYHDPETGKINAILIRQDYDVGTIPSYNEDEVISVENFAKTSWDDVVSQMKAVYRQRNSESDAVAISQDAATIAMLGNRIKSSTQSFPFLYDPDTANEIASRERAQLSVPLFRITLKFNRAVFGLRPGAVFKFSWDDYGIANVVLRVQKFNLGALLNGEIVVDCIQDRFALADVIYATPEASQWVAPVTDPSDIETYEVIEMPRYWGARLEEPVTDGQAMGIPLVVPPSTVSTGMDFLIGKATGVYEIRDPQEITYEATGTLVANYDRDTGLATGLDVTGFILENVTGTFPAAPSATARSIGEAGIIYVDGEFMSYAGATVNMDDTVTLDNIQRGLFGTTVLAHLLGTRVYYISIEMLGDGFLDDLGDTDTLYYKLLDRAGPKVQDPSEVSEDTLVMNEIANSPLRPRFLQLGGERVDIAITNVENVELTWRSSNREAEEISVESDAAETPDQAETYNLDVYIGGVLNATLSEDDISSPYAVKFGSTLITEETGELRLYAGRTVGDLAESKYYGWLPFSIDQEAAPTPPAGSLWDNETDYPDITSANLLHVYSTRLRITGYTGPGVRIRDSVGGAEQDVDFISDGSLDSFTVTGDAQVVKWYDQAGSLDLSVEGTNYPLLDITGSTKGLPIIDFGSGVAVLESDTFSDAAPNDITAVDRPVFFGYVEYTPKGGFNTLWNIPQIDGANTNPYGRISMLEGNAGPQGRFESRWNGTNQVWNTSLITEAAWIIDPAENTSEVRFYVDSATVNATLASAGALTFPNNTRLKFGANGASSEAATCKFADFVIMDNATTNTLRGALIDQMKTSWYS